MPLGAGGVVQAPDISSMSPDERADRLFNRVMRLSSEGKADSAAFFGPMALGALEALAPLNAHRRYDMGLVALVSGDVSRATAQGDTILAERPTHLLGLALAARAADARGDATRAAGTFVGGCSLRNRPSDSARFRSTRTTMPTFAPQSNLRENSDWTGVRVV